MKILYLKLVNSAGIFAGTSKREISIDFLKSKNKITMLFGKNGSGKTTILSSLNPFINTTNDDRDTFFLNEVEGQKEIHYKYNDLVYIIWHLIDSKKKITSFLYELSYDDYIEIYNKHNSDEKERLIELKNYAKDLNENGGVRSFKSLIEEIFGINEDYFKISRIGSNVTNFVDLKTSERKKYISNFLPDVDEYLIRYKIVTDKLKVLNKEIKFVSDELTKLGELDELNSNKERIQLLIQEYNNAREEIYKELIENKMKLKGYYEENPELKDIDLFDNSNYNRNIYNEEYEKIKKDLNKFLKIFESDNDDNIREDIKRYENELKLKNEEYIKNSNDFMHYKVELDKLTKNISDTNHMIKQKENELSGLDYEEIETLNQYKEELKNKIKELKENINGLSSDKNLLDKYKDNLNYELSKSFLNQIITTLKPFETLGDILDNNFKEILTKAVNDEKKLDINIKIIKDKISELENENIFFKNTIKQQEYLLGRQKENLKYLSILENKPNDCVNRNCSFIKEALKYSNIENEIENTEIEIKKYKEKLLENETELANYNNIYNYLNNIYNLLNSNKEEKLDISIQDIEANLNIKTITKFILYERNKLKILFKNFKDFLYDFKEYELINLSIKKNEETIKTIDDKIKSNSKLEKIKNNYEKELNELRKNKKEYETDLIELKVKIEKLNIDKIKNEINKIEETTKNLKFFLETILKRNEIEIKYFDYENILNESSEIATKLITLKNKVKNQDNEINNFNDELRKIELKIERHNDYIKRKKNLEKDYDTLKLIKDATSPTNGIPIYYIQNYLKTTERITNDLLYLSQKGSFVIKFEINEKDFFIKVFKDNGDILEDIKIASQGEMALTIVSLSLALMEQSKSNYNIPIFDEIDGALDENNRRSFIDMIEKQTSDMEQVFIISHNNEFDYYPMDLILLKNNTIPVNNTEFMSNKNIIFKI